MRASGNGDVKVCVENLLQIVRGENPYERLKGIDGRIVDRPAIEAEADISQDAEWCVSEYEPRAILEGVTVEGVNSTEGDFRVTAHISES